VFNGFSSSDFDVFSLPDFASRMPVLKAQITPKLKAIGEEFAPKLSRAIGHTVYPHVAQHLRRSVNAPEETWVAFAREKRAYKPFIHTRIAINGNGVRITVHLEDYAEDKRPFANALANSIDEIAAYLREYPEITSCDLVDPYGKPLAGRSLDHEALTRLTQRLQTIKGQHATFAIVIPRRTKALQDNASIQRIALKEMKKLFPIYELALSG